MAARLVPAPTLQVVGQVLLAAGTGLAAAVIFVVVPEKVTSAKRESLAELMAGLMLADKTAAVEDEIRGLKARLVELESRPDTRVEVPVIPPQVEETLAEIAARAEAMAARIEEKARA